MVDKEGKRKETDKTMGSSPWYMTDSVSMRTMINDPIKLKN